MRRKTKKNSIKKEKFKHLKPLEAVNEMAQGLYDAGLIDLKTMRDFKIKKPEI